MDAKGLRALLWVLVVSGCAVALLSSASVGAVADTVASGATLQDDTNEDEQSDDANVTTERNRLDNADEVHIDVFLTENGSATLEVKYRYHLENNSTQQWETLRDDIDSNPEAYTDTEVSDWNQTLADAANQTEREMAITNASVSTDEISAPRSIGTVQFRFEWTSFANVELNEIEAGDALSGFPLVDDMTLQIVGPDGYVVSAHEPSPDASESNSVFWSGSETEFTDEQPRVVFIEDSNSTAQTSDSDEGPSTEWLAVVGALALLVLAGAIGWLIRHRRDDGFIPSSPDITRPATDGSSPDPGTGNDSPPPELLSNEERVLRLLEDRGGRIKQQEVVSELDWTEAKTSQVVGRLREDDEIDVFRIGRENVLALPDDDLEE